MGASDHRLPVREDTEENFRRAWRLTGASDEEIKGWIDRANKAYNLMLFPDGMIWIRKESTE